jgi:hypothetical protein
LDNFVFSDEAVINVSGEVNKRNSWILSVENSDVQACRCKKCDRSVQLRARFRCEINRHQGLYRDILENFFVAQLPHILFQQDCTPPLLLRHARNFLYIH